MAGPGLPISSQRSSDSTNYPNPLLDNRIHHPPTTRTPEQPGLRPNGAVEPNIRVRRQGEIIIHDWSTRFVRLCIRSRGPAHREGLSNELFRLGSLSTPARFAE
jgi:hypothetical protein